MERPPTPEQLEELHQQLRAAIARAHARPPAEADHATWKLVRENVEAFVTLWPLAKAGNVRAARLARLTAHFVISLIEEDRPQG